MAERPMPARSEMPFLDHLEELRWRLIWSLAALAIGVAIGFWLVLELDLIKVMAGPIQPYLRGQNLVITHPTDPFSIVLKASFILGTLLALPVILYQVWAFLSPALYGHEKKVVIPVLVGAVALFAAGASFAYFVVLPLTLKFLHGFQMETLTPMITAQAYYGFAISMALALGATFELPIAIVALTALGIVTPVMLVRWRRHAFVACLVGAAFVSPGDFLGTTILMTVPLYVLYELSIVLSGIVHRRKLRSQERIGAEAGAPA
jgi:sec-independent protein translocase protein TatC